MAQQKTQEQKKAELAAKAIEEAAKAELAAKANKVIKAKSKVKEYKVKEGNFDKKRNFHVKGEMILLEVGKTVTDEVRNKFHAKFQELYFEEV